MLRSLPQLPTPDDTTVIWRYLSLDRFLALITRSSLHMARIDHLEDPWEGAWPRSILSLLREPPRSPDSWTQIQKSLSELRVAYFVSCWHKADIESAALWRLYGGDAGIAIRTTVGRLRAAIRDPRDFYLAEVQYVDFNSLPSIPGGTQGLAFLKRRSFVHEQEVRLLYFELPVTGSQMTPETASLSHAFAVDLAGLIESIHVSPHAKQWTVELVRSLASRILGNSCPPVVQSGLYDPFSFDQPA